MKNPYDIQKADKPKPKRNLERIEGTFDCNKCFMPSTVAFYNRDKSVVAWTCMHCEFMNTVGGVTID